MVAETLRIPSPLDRAALKNALAHWPVAVLSINRPGGAPWSVPIVFAPWEGRVYSPIDGKPKSERPVARATHIAREGRATLLLERYDPDWQALWWIRLYARAEVVSPAPLDHPAVGALAAKYPQYRSVPVLRPPPMLLAFDLEAVAAWSSAPSTEGESPSARFKTRR